MNKKKTFKVIGILVMIAIAIFYLTRIFAAAITHTDGTVTQSTQWGWYQLTEDGEIEYSDNGYTGEKLGDYQSEGEALSAARDGIGYEELQSEGWIFCIEHGYPLPSKSKNDYIYQVRRGGDFNSNFHDAVASSNILGTQDNSSQLTDDEIDILEDKSTIGQRIKYNEERAYNAYQESGFEYWSRRLDTTNATITTVSTEDGTMDWASGYILANSDPNSTIEENEAQLALWKALNFNPGKDSAIAESELYRKAKAFEQYKKESSEEGPKVSEDGQTEYKYKFVSEGNYLIAGPIKIEYGPFEVEYNGTTLEVMQIDDLLVYGTNGNGEKIEITEYEFTDEGGNPLSDMVETLDGKKFPKTGTDFYIKVNYRNPIYGEIKTIDSFEVSFYMLDLRASAYKVENVGIVYTEWAPNNKVYEKCEIEHNYYEYNGIHSAQDWCYGNKHEYYTSEYDDDAEQWIDYYECYTAETYKDTYEPHPMGEYCGRSYCDAWSHDRCEQIGHGTIDEDMSSSLLIKQHDSSPVPSQKLWLLHKAEMFWQKYKLVVLFGPENPPSTTPTPPNPPSTTPTPSHKTYIDIGGDVWVDDVESKQGSQDGLDGVKGTGTDYPRPNVEVTLYFEDGSKVTKADVAEYAQADFKNPTLTDENGHYMFYQLPMDKKYYVEFVYDGMMYETTEFLAGGSVSEYKSNPNLEVYDTNSKAEENEQDRRTFNDRFAEITGNGPSSLAGDKTTGKTSTGLTLLYKSKVFDKTFQSRLLTTDVNPEDYDVTNNHAIGKVKSDYKMTVRTSDKDLIYPFENDIIIWSAGKIDETKYLRHINLGLKRRVTSDLRLAVDIKAGATTIKDKEKVVFYKSNAKMDDLMVDATEQTNDYIKQEISASDYNWAKEYNNIYGQDVSTGFKIADDQLNVYVLYRIAVANQSESTENTGIVTEIVDYFDNKLEMVPEKDIEKVTKLFTTKGFVVPQGVASWVAEDNTKVTWTTSGTVGNYTAIKTEGLNLDLGGSGSSKSIYLILKVKNNGDVLYTGLEDGKTGIENIAEITSYKILDKDGKPAGLVDCDSAPYNATPGNKSTYEDDTDNAPMFQLVLNWEPRKISGNVWDDGLEGDAQQNNPGVKNVEVELIEYIYNEDDGSLVAVVRPGLKFTNNSVSVNKNDNVRTDENGNYEFYVEGGNYAVRFTYGDTVMLKDGTSKKYNAQDFYAAQPYSALSGMSQYNQEHSKAFATEEDLVAYLQNEQKLEIDNLDASGDKAQSNWETSNWSADTTNNLSNAREYSHIRAQVIENAFVLTNSNGTLLNKLSGTNGLSDEDAIKLSGNNNTQSPNYTYMEAISDIVVVSSNDLVQTGKIINLGLEERPTASLELKKEVNRIVVKTNDGVTLIDTADSSKLTGLQQLGSDNPIDQTFINMDAITMEGATIDIDYEITVTNKGQKDYLQNYVYIQEDEKVMDDLAKVIGDKIEEPSMTRNTELPVRAKTIYDYVNINLEYRTDDNKNADGNELWTKVYEEGNNSLSPIPEGLISTDVANALPRTQRKVSKVLKTSDAAENTAKNLLVGEGATIPIHLGITLAEDTSGDLGNDAFTYSNCAEIVEIYSGAGRRDYESVPGNYVPYSEEQEPDQDLTGTTIITPPLGQERIYYVIAIISATIIIAGIVLIKKKVLNK